MRASFLRLYVFAFLEDTNEFRKSHHIELILLARNSTFTTHHKIRNWLWMVFSLVLISFFFNTSLIDNLLIWVSKKLNIAQRAFKLEKD